MKNIRQLFDRDNPAGSFVVSDDFVSSGCISGAKSIPISRLKIGNFHMSGGQAVAGELISRVVPARTGLPSQHPLARTPWCLTLSIWNVNLACNTGPVSSLTSIAIRCPAPLCGLRDASLAMSASGRAASSRTASVVESSGPSSSRVSSSPSRKSKKYRFRPLRFQIWPLEGSKQASTSGLWEQVRNLE